MDSEYLSTSLNPFCSASKEASLDNQGFSPTWISGICSKLGYWPSLQLLVRIKSCSWKAGISWATTNAAGPCDSRKRAAQAGEGKAKKRIRKALRTWSFTRFTIKNQAALVITHHKFHNQRESDTSSIFH